MNNLNPEKENKEHQKQVNAIIEHYVSAANSIDALIKEKHIFPQDQLIICAMIFSAKVEKWINIIEEACEKFQKKYKKNHMPSIMQEYYPTLLQLREKMPDLISSLIYQEEAWKELRDE